MVNADAYDRNTDWCWSSRGQSPAQALVQAEHFSSVQIARTRIDDRSGNYGIDWRHYALGPVALNFLSVTPQQVRRTCAMTSADRNDGYDLLLMRSGSAHMAHGGSSCALAPGGMILLDCAQSWDLEFPVGSDCLTAHMDGAWLKRWMPDPTERAGIGLDASHPWSAPLAAVISAIALDGLERAPVSRGLLADQLGSLLALATGQPVERQGRHANDIVARIRLIVRDRFAYADLCANTVAREIGISRRYLDKLLAGAGTSFLAMLEQHRLEAARSRLIDRPRTKEQIGDIAWGCGFTDPGYFARRFRRRFGTSPRDYA